MDPITLDQDLANKLDLGMRSGEAVELPFPVIYLWALNGQASYKSQGGALYYGGWACKIEDAQPIADYQGLTLPADWKPATIALRDGGEIEVMVARYLIVAPFARRISWLFDGKRYPEYVEGGRRHLQVLAYLAEKKGENGKPKFIPWGPVVLTAKGHQVGHVLDAFKKWNKATAQIRARVAPKVPAWCFYFSIGTFGKDRQSVNVGKSGAQSPITPVSAWIPENLNEDMIRSLFVGGETAAVMAEYQGQAADWLAAWKEPSPAEQAIQASDDSFLVTGPEAASEDELPF